MDLRGDQLQDALGTKFLEPSILYNQIIRHSKHQFLEGDVEHWWHEENNRGVRTKFSDEGSFPKSLYSQAHLKGSRYSQ